MSVSFDRVPDACETAASVRLEGYSPRNGLAHGSLDVVVYACAEHTDTARTEWLAGFLPYTTTPGRDVQCGDRITFGGAQ